MTRLRLLDSFVVLCQVGLLIALNVRFAEVVGGSMVFLVVTGACVYFSYVRKVFQQELTWLSLAALCVVALNVLAYYERVETFPRVAILIAYFLLAQLFSSAIYRVNISRIRVPREGPPEPEAAKRQLIRNIATLFISIPYLALMLFALPSGLLLWIGQRSRLVQWQWLSITILAIAWQVIGAAVHSAFLKKFSDAQIVHVLKLPQRIPVQGIVQKLTAALLVLFVLGSIAELGRGLWAFWVGSFAFWTLTLRNSWKVWQHAFASATIAYAPEEIKVGYNILEDFRVFLVAAAIAAAYGITLAVTLGLTIPKTF